MVTLLGSLIQMLIYGAVTIWISAVLSMLMCYVYLQNNNLAMDALTHLNNRRRFDEFVKTESEHPNQLGEFFLLVLDIDHFKMINDTYGHAEGDQALVSAACVLKKAMEDEHGFLARIGGDEFAIILPAANEDIIENLIFKIRCLMDNTNKEAGKPSEINFSIGHASQYGNELNFEKLFSDADENMYESKKKNHDKSTCS
jgi:diguanylate cyclase (GGDEF)-like protein